MGVTIEEIFLPWNGHRHLISYWYEQIKIMINFVCKKNRAFKAILMEGGGCTIGCFIFGTFFQVKLLIKPVDLPGDLSSHTKFQLNPLRFRPPPTAKFVRGVMNAYRRLFLSKTRYFSLSLCVLKYFKCVLKHLKWVSGVFLRCYINFGLSKMLECYNLAWFLGILWLKYTSTAVF